MPRKEKEDDRRVKHHEMCLPVCAVAVNKYGTAAMCAERVFHRDIRISELDVRKEAQAFDFQMAERQQAGWVTEECRVCAMNPGETAA